MITLARPRMTTASLLVLTTATSGAQAVESCSAYPTGTADKIESSDLAKLSAVPKPAKELHFAYVTKTLIKNFGKRSRSA
jgi:ribose transport system substrate-binding protein